MTSPTVTVAVKADTSQAVSEVEKLIEALGGLMDPKTGYRTTEFWVTVLTHVAWVVAVVFHRDLSNYVPAAAVLAAAIATAVYSVSRGQVKSAHAGMVRAAMSAGTSGPASVPDPPPAASVVPPVALAVAPTTG